MNKKSHIENTVTPQIINTTVIDTDRGAKKFELVRGDISILSVDLLIFSTHAGKSKPSGGVYSALRHAYGKIDLSRKKQVVSLKEDSLFDIHAVHPDNKNFSIPSSTYLIEPNSKMPFKNILMLRLPGPAFFPNSKEALKGYELAIKAVFSSIASLEYYGKIYESISLPILGGARSFDKRKTIEILLKNALQWLEFSQHTNKISFVIFEPNEINDWDKAMNECLKRTYYKINHEKSIEFVKRRLKRRVSRELSPGP